ncbi:MAG: hypothetical protein R3343_06720 [Nitriliruptorales bacterium]|nr:hypothetical protein [Nitriliruptorales bacterium]
MNDLEQRLRESLQARAQDVEVTPHLWDEVERRLHRRRLSTMLVWAAGAAAAAALAAVVVLPAVLDTPDRDVVVDPLPSETATTDPDPDQPPAAGAPNALVAASDRDIRLLGLDGSELATLVRYSSEEFEGRILSVATSPTAADGTLGVAFTVLQEGNVELRVVRADNRPETVDTTHVGWTGELVPQPVWSPDGTQLAWIDTTDGRAELKAASWTPGDTGGVLGEPISLGTVDGLGDYQLQQWTRDGILAIRSDLRRGTLAVDDGTLRGVEDLTNGAAILDVARTTAGEFTLVASSPDVPEDQGDAEGTIARLLYVPIGEDPIDVTLPDVFTQGTSNPQGMWMNAQHETAVVGWGGLAWMVTIDGQVTELPGQVDAAEPVVLGDGTAPEPPDGPTAAPVPAGGPWVVVTETEMTLARADGSQTVLMDWQDDAEFKPARVEVRPGSTVDDLVAVVMTAGEGETELGWVEVRDGTPAGYRRFPDPYQMGSELGLDGGSTSVPIWSPDGAYLGWVEEPGDGSGGSSGQFLLRVVGWDDGPGTGNTATDNTAFELEPFAGFEDVTLDQWIWNGEEEGTLFFRFAASGVRGYISSVVGRQPDGAITYEANARGGDDRVDEAHADGVVYRLASGNGLTLVIQQPGAESQYDLPASFRSDLVRDLPPAAGPWLEPEGDGALLFSADQRVWRVEPDGSTTELAGGGVRDLDAVD